MFQISMSIFFQFQLSISISIFNFQISIFIFQFSISIPDFHSKFQPHFKIDLLESKIVQVLIIFNFYLKSEFLGFVEAPFSVFYYFCTTEGGKFYPHSLESLANVGWHLYAAISWKIYITYSNLFCYLFLNRIFSLVLAILWIEIQVQEENLSMSNNPKRC